MAISSADAIKAIAAIEKQLSALRAFAGLPAVAVKSKKAQGSQPASDEPEKKRTLSPALLKRNEEVKALFEELKAAWLSANAEYAALDAKALAAAIKNSECEPKPLYSAALQEHSRRQREGNPEAEAKFAAYRAKVEADPRRKKGSVASVSSASSAPKPEPVADVKKRKPQSEETKAAAAIKRAATKAAKLLVPAAAAAPNPFDETPLPAAPAGAEVVEASADDEEAFAEWEHKGAKYWKNGLQHVYKMSSDKGFGVWAGRYDELKKVIDARVPEPPVE